MPTMRIPSTTCSLPLSLIIGGCTVPNPDYCDDSRPCSDPERPYCDLAGDFGLRNTCSPNPQIDAGSADAGVARADAAPDAGSLADAGDFDSMAGAIDAGSPADAGDFDSMAGAIDAGMPDGCVPMTCGDLGADCGETLDGCGSPLDCGACELPAVCGADSTPNTCSPGRVVLVAFGRFAENNDVYTNNGTTLSFNMSFGLSDWTGTLDFGDMDGDGDLDLAVGNATFPVVVWRNSGTDTFGSFWTAPMDRTTNAVRWGDMDGDGDLDLAVANGTGQASQVYENEGTFFTLKWSSPQTDDNTDIAWGDYDGDGDLDLVASFFGVANRVYKNDGTGNFTLAFTSAEEDDSNAVDWGDFDGDGDLDFAVGNRLRNRVYRNNGSDSFAVVFTSSDSKQTMSVDWGDHDGDGDPDLLVANERSSPGNGTVNQVFRNDGGAFIQAWTSPQAEATAEARWGDFDYDGDLDIFVVNVPSLTSAADPWGRVYRNNGGDTFAAGAWTSPVEMGAFNSVALGFAE